MIAESLSRQLRSQVPHAFERPIPYIKIAMFWRDPEMFPYLLDQSGISFPVLALELAGAQELGRVQEALQIAVEGQYETNGVSTPESVRIVIQPNTPQNILAHEFEHGIALPVKKRWGAQIRLAFSCARDRTLRGILGVCDFGDHRFSAAEGAIVASNPKWLSPDDIDIATTLALATNDTNFVAEINQRIASRRKLSELGIGL